MQCALALSFFPLCFAVCLFLSCTSCFHLAWGRFYFNGNKPSQTLASISSEIVQMHKHPDSLIWCWQCSVLLLPFSIVLPPRMLCDIVTLGRVSFQQLLVTSTSLSLSSSVDLVCPQISTWTPRTEVWPLSQPKAFLTSQWAEPWRTLPIQLLHSAWQRKRQRSCASSYLRLHFKCLSKMFFFFNDPLMEGIVTLIHILFMHCMV